MQLFSAGSKSVAKTAYFHKSPILTKRKSHVLSLLGCLTSISHCSIWNMAIANEDAQVLKAHLQSEGQPAQQAAAHTPTLANACTKQMRAKHDYGHSQRPSSLPIALVCTRFDSVSCFIGSSSLHFHVLSGRYARCHELQKDVAISYQLGNFLLTFLSVRPLSSIFQSVCNTICFKIAPSYTKDL